MYQRHRGLFPSRRAGQLFLLALLAGLTLLGGRLAPARANGITYNRLIQGLKAAEVEVDRKNLAELAVSDPAAFTALVEVARAALPADVNAPSGEAA